MKYDVCQPEGQLSQELPENDATISFDAFQGQTFEEDHDDPILNGIFSFHLSPWKFIIFRILSPVSELSRHTQAHTRHPDTHRLSLLNFEA